ncbi:hypothetical protein LOZ66_000493 [Ophidiomyces ophidiicola]|nr:hypothetical protein LOZ65_000695 [Ophidiomyces ophidiicola]KAI1943906.1 hypothetical protein LOZ66_000493 [Ophidiomyces ophidiicola]
MVSNILARPKRAAEEYARQHHAGYDSDGPSSTKKARFDIRNPSTLVPDAAEEDIVLDADEIGRRGQKLKRNAVNIDGYDSDSENENFATRAEAKAKASTGAGDAGDDDMFAEFDDEEKVPDGDSGQAKKSVRFLDDSEIEGQINDSRSGGKVSLDGLHSGRKGKEKAVDDASSDSDTDEEGRADLGGLDKELGAGGKKTHAPLLDAFNMKSEQEEGRFDEAGNYIRKALDPDAVHDSWLEGVSKKDMKKAKAAAEKREEERRQKSIADSNILTGDLLKTLITNTLPGETVLEALARLGKGQKHRPKWQNKNKNRHKNLDAPVDDVDMIQEDPAETARKSAIEELTGAADVLLSRGQIDIYETEREMLARQYRRETGEEWTEPSPLKPAAPEVEESAMWEFRWSDARDGGGTHGPYDMSTMASWQKAGYFGDDGVMFRKADSTDDWRTGVVFA